MLSRLVVLSLANRPAVLLAAVLVVVGGGYAATRLPIDAVPDITNVQVQVLTKAPALGPVEMEQFVTYPIEAAMNGLPRLTEIRSISRYGLSAVTVVFEDGVDVYFARQLVAERLVQAREAIPEGLGNPEMGPVTTGLGDVFQFTVEGEGISAMERRTVLDWMIAPRLRAVPGVTEVNTWGGLPKQYQVVVDPAKLVSHRLALKDVFEAVQRGSMNAGGGYIEHNREQYILRGEGLVGSFADIEKIVLTVGAEGTPVTVGHVAQVREGAMLRIGVATADGRGETVIGLVQMLAGENALDVATRVRAAVEALLGRPVQGDFEVVLRHRDGSPVVLRNAPFLHDGTPMPTRYWLVGEPERTLVSRLEADGGVRAAEADVDPDELAAAHARYVAPFKDAIERLGRVVFGPSPEVELDSDLRIAARRLDGTRLPFDQLSTGAREQLGIISRLACATIVAGDDGAPVILADTLGWTDPQRLTQMAAAIGVAGRSCQIVLLTCTPGRFAHVGAATVVRLPGPGPELAARSSA